MKIDKASLQKPNASTPAVSQGKRQEGHQRRLLRWDAAVVIMTLMILAAAAGILLARQVISPRPSLSMSLSPLPATPIPPTPSPQPTATATLLQTGDALETLYVEIQPEDFAKLTAKRDEALQLGILLASGDDYVPATMRLQGAQIPVELRLKGDWVDHLIGDKWSFRVRTVGENYLLGMRVFSLQDPSTRSFLNEWLFLENLRREDVLAVRYQFLHVVLNGEYKGIYALEEGFTKELFEAQQRREGLIVRYAEDLVWEYRAYYQDQLIPRGVNQFHVIDEFQSGTVKADPALSAQRDNAIGLLRALWAGEQGAAGVFDLDKMGTFLALSDLWSAPHGLIWHNLRYYYNPVTARLEPIAFDSDALAGELDMAGLPQSAFYNDPALQAAYVRALQRVSQPGYIEALESVFGPQFETLRATLEPEFGADPLAPPWEVLRQRQELLRQVLKPYQTVYAHTEEDSTSSGTSLYVGNLLELPVEVMGLDIGGTQVRAHRAWVDPASAELLAPAVDGEPDALVLRALDPDATFMPYVRLEVPPDVLPAALDGDITILTRLWGLTEGHADPVLTGYPSPLAQGPRPAPPTVEEVLAQQPFLQHDAETKMLSIAGGTWDVSGSLILPAGYGLRLGPGTVLRFEHDGFLLSSGPLDFQGTEDAPIRLGPIADQWQGIAVLNAGGPSYWEYVTVERAATVDQAGWTLTGGVTFYESPIHLVRSHILDSQGEDGINVIRAEFEFVHSEFGKAFSDAFDADFGQGTISDCSFHDTGGDGIDVSGSDVQVEAVKFRNIADKAISVGEASRLTARHVQMEDVNFGVASKDLSQATLEDAVIDNARIAGLAVYVKKPAYGPASLRASNIRFSDTPAERYTLVQTGSWIELEGQRLSGTDIDVDALYKQ